MTAGTTDVNQDELEGNEDPINKEISKRYYQDYDSLTEAQQLKSGTKEEHDARRAEYGFTGVNSNTDTRPRMAGEALRQLKRAEERNETGIANAENAVFGGGLENFDATAYGAGMGRGTARLSKADIKGLRKQGVSKQEILDYVEANPDVNSSGGKAQKLLNKFKTSLTEDGETPNGTTPDEGEPVGNDPVENDNPPSPDTPESGTLPVDAGNQPSESAGGGQGRTFDLDNMQTPEVIDSRYWSGDKHMNQVNKNLDSYQSRNREGLDYYTNAARSLTDHYRNTTVGDPMGMLQNASDSLFGYGQRQRDIATIEWTKMFGDMDNFKPNPVSNEPYSPPPTADLGDVTDDMMDRIDDM